MSLLATIEKFLPRAWRPLNILFLGSNRAHRVERASISITIIAIIFVVSLMASSGIPIFSTGFGNNVNVINASYKVSTSPSSIPIGGSLVITANVKNYIPSTTLAVSITVAGPCASYQSGGHSKKSPPPTCSGYSVLGSEVLTVAVDSQGNGEVSTAYPFSQPFSGSASTTNGGTYLVLATFSFAYASYNAYTTFQVG